MLNYVLDEVLGAIDTLLDFFVLVGVIIRPNKFGRNRWNNTCGLLDLQHLDQPFKIIVPALYVDLEVRILLHFCDQFVSPIRIAV